MGMSVEASEPGGDPRVSMSVDRKRARGYEHGRGYERELDPDQHCKHANSGT